MKKVLPEFNKATLDLSVEWDAPINVVMRGFELFRQQSSHTTKAKVFSFDRRFPLYDFHHVQTSGWKYRLLSILFFSLWSNPLSGTNLIHGVEGICKKYLESQVR